MSKLRSASGRLNDETRFDKDSGHHKSQIKNMLSAKDIQKLTIYLTEAFKPVFATKEDIKEIKGLFNQTLNSLDGLTKIGTEVKYELKAMGNNWSKHDEWITRASKKIRIPYNP